MLTYFKTISQENYALTFILDINVNFIVHLRPRKQSILEILHFSVGESYFEITYTQNTIKLVYDNVDRHVNQKKTHFLQYPFVSTKKT